MPAISVFDIFKIGVGPSSSHTIGPWKAARNFLTTLPAVGYDRLDVYLYGSLSKTGRGHATDAAVQLGLLDHDPERVDTSRIPDILADLATNRTLHLGAAAIVFDPAVNIVFTDASHKAHPNTLQFILRDGPRVVHEVLYASVGGGFIRRVGERTRGKIRKLPYPIATGADLLRHADREGWSAAQVVLANELSLRSEPDIRKQLRQIYLTMRDAVYRGCTTDGILPGGLNVKRRARSMCHELLDRRPFADVTEWERRIKNAYQDFNSVNQWISCFALAVNEENAAMGRIVTSPTNGAAGVVPAVLLYYHYFCSDYDEPLLDDFLLVAGEIGSLFKKGATISAAVGGCQAEIGVSSAMAAGGLTQVLGGSPRQVLMAAEIAMEHHLGLTCDPVGGLVQIPCIERNAMGAMKAITAANLALSGDPAHSKVKFDMVVKTMWETAKAMSKRFKETAEGGLAVQVPVGLAEC